MSWKSILLLAALHPYFCNGQQNLAAFKPSNQSSTYSVYGPQLANDENEKTCSISGESDVASREKVFGWWQVDLLMSYSVSYLLIKTPPNSYEAKFLSNIVVFVTNFSSVDLAGTANICAKFLDDNPPVDGWISLDCKSSGRFVTFKRGGGFRHDAISFCDVRVVDGDSTAQCPSLMFRCLSGHCINASKHCNGFLDCPDKSDEDGCSGASSSSSSSSSSLPTPSSRQLLSTSIQPSSSSSPPSSTTRTSSVITSTTSSPLITSTKTLPSPPQSSSPPPQSSSSPPPTTSSRRSYCGSDSFDCRDGSCIAAMLLCDGFYDCTNRIDEDDCIAGNSCNSNDFVCLNHQCIEKGLTCDGFPDCSDDSDERPSQCGNSTIPPFTCSVGYRACGDGTCIPSSKMCDRIVSCSDKSDESTRTCGIPFNECVFGDFICFSGQCISGSYKCDNKSDCSDGSDENVNTCGVSRPKNPCLPEAEFRCSDGSCIDNDLKCNGRADCPDGKDESHCVNCTGNEFLCQLDNVCIQLYKRCNGRADCLDRSDEEKCNECSSPAHHCRPLTTCLSPRLICDYVVDCPDGSDESNCSTCPSGSSRCTYGPCIPDAYLCDGNLDCPYGDDEDPSSCMKRCTEQGFYCSYFGCIDRKRLCDGVVDCPLEEDEKEGACQLVGVCSKNQYKCMDKKCIPNEWICDGESDCHLGEDENPDECRLCNANQFQCLSGRSECIPTSNRCDGRKDCRDGSDELGCIWMVQTASRAWQVLVLVNSAPHVLCINNIRDQWKAIICKYMMITSLPPVNITGVHNMGFVILDQTFELKSTFSLVRAFRISSFCNATDSLECNFSKKCGTTDVESGLAGGYPAERGTWPWHAVLRVHPRKICGATFIGGPWYLTSASCVTTKGSNGALNERSLKLYTDTLNDDGSGGGMQIILEVIVHPDYDHRTATNDVALLRTRSEPGSPDVHEVCLPDPLKYTINETSKLKICYVSGFGFNRRDGFPSPVLLSARFKMMDQKQCSIRIFNSSNVPAVVDYSENLCTGSYESPFNFNICEFDFGGPLVCRGNDLKWTQVGIASRNIGSSCKNSLFTRITPHISFIYDTMIMDLN